jgi:hypothetical protein
MMRIISKATGIRLLRLFHNIMRRTKHGPRGSGERGSCDKDCLKCEAEKLIDEFDPLRRYNPLE